MIDDFDPEVDDEATRIVSRSVDSSVSDDDATRVVSRDKHPMTEPEEDKTVVISRTPIGDDATRISAKKLVPTGDFDDQTALAPHRVRRTIRVQDQKISAEAKAPDVPVGTSQVFTKPAFVAKEVARTDFGVPNKQQSLSAQNPSSVPTVTIRERNRAIKLGVFLAAGCVVAIAGIVAIIILS